ncbi:MAG: MerR family transcriptional regulator [Planctomycetota bacterium]|jgi:hypothetical protein
MKLLEQLANSSHKWSLSEFVEKVNTLLPQYLPVKKGNTKVRELITPRLVRHFAALGMLDDPHKIGRESRYSYRHLLQLLVVRRLMSEGYGAKAIDNLARLTDNSGLEALLHGGAKLRVTIANPALAFLTEIQKRSDISKTVSRSAGLPISLTPPHPATATHWTRTEILPGLELNIGDNFHYPNSIQEQQALIQHINHTLTEYAKNRRPSK